MYLSVYMCGVGWGCLCVHANLYVWWCDEQNGSGCVCVGVCCGEGVRGDV